MTIHYEKDDQGIVVLSMDMPGRSQNVINEDLLNAFKGASERLFSEDSLSGIIITSSKKDFLAGADIDMLFQITEPKVLMEWLETYKMVLRKLETQDRPLVAAINGSALGGG